MVKKSKKKSTTKYFKSSRVPVIIPIIAVIEVIILIAVSSYAWYYLNASKEISSDIITVNADSGLDIDFKEANDKSFIDLWDYIDQDFAFEPATSVDGRNIYFPTRGTFSSINTANMTFREGTANDINTKYINIDFELTNTTEDEMGVYLSSKSKFTISDRGNLLNGSALRLAFYNNDGNSGNVSSSMISRMSTTNQTITENESSDESKLYENYTVYFYKPRANYTPKIYLWCQQAGNPNNGGYYKAWPGTEINHISGNLYYFTFKNYYSYIDNTLTGDSLTAEANRYYYYNKVKFTNGYDGSTNSTDNFNLVNGAVYNMSNTSENGGSTKMSALKTFYFLKPSGWGTLACTPTKDHTSDQSSDYYLTDTGMSQEPLTEVTPGIYSYTVPVDFKYIQFYDTTNTGAYYTAWIDISEIENNSVVFYPTSPTRTANMALSTTTYGEDTIFFYNTHAWDLPYACVNAFAGSVGTYTFAIPMVALSSNVYYCTVPSVYLSDKNSNSANCQVYFSSTEDTTDNTSRTDTEICLSKYIYRPTTAYNNDTDKYWTLDTDDYNKFSTSGENNYAVISPGVSSGFQRSANPVASIDPISGAAESIIPAFATSFDDYIYGSDHPVFTIQNGQTVNMSMIIWLEGTDTHCTSTNYSAKDINLYLEFVTRVSQEQSGSAEPEGTFVFHFIDATEQTWTSEVETNKKTKVSVSPVMQLYDKNIKRGYLMTAHSRTSYAGKKRVSVWECRVPRSIVYDNHELEFRRVNPYNEDQIWNKWEAGSVYELYNSAYGNTYLKDSEGAIAFTAFADGSPDYTTYHSRITGLTEKSCGGLWGSFGVDQLVVYDGRYDSNRNLTTGTNTLTIQYTFTYPGTNITTRIEYRTAGTWRDIVYDAEQGYSGNNAYRSNFYGFQIPKLAYEYTSDCCFREYNNFDDDYAINASENSSLTLECVWYTKNPSDNNDTGRISGNFFEFNEEKDVKPDNNDHTARNTSEPGYHSYWGSDVVYIQVKNGTNTAFENGDNPRWTQIRYFNDPSNVSSGDLMFSYLNKDDNYKGNRTDYGSYVSVIPSEKSFSYYRFEATDSWEEHSSYTITLGNVSITQHSPELASDGTTTLFYHNTTCTVAENGTYTNTNILSIEHRINIWVSAGNFSNDVFGMPKVYWWMKDANGSTYDSGTSEQFYEYYNIYGKRVVGFCIPNGAGINIFNGAAIDNHVGGWQTSDITGTAHNKEYCMDNGSDAGNCTVYEATAHSGGYTQGYQSAYPYEIFYSWDSATYHYTDGSTTTTIHVPNYKPSSAHTGA